MQWFDAVGLLLIIVLMVRGFQFGALRQAIFGFGLVLGVALSLVLTPSAVRLMGSYVSRGVITAVLLAVVLTACGIVFEMLAYKAKLRIQRRLWHMLDALLGVLTGGLYSLALIWVFTSVFASGPSPQLSAALQESRLAQATVRYGPRLPQPLAKLRRYASSISLPQAFIGEEPVSDGLASQLSATELAALRQAAAASVVKITGPGCGGIVEGSGYVAASNVVLTNAHVVAGTRSTTVSDERGSRRGTVIYVNPDLDVALIRVNSLAGPVLSLDAAAEPRGTAGVVMGYPGGGDLQTVAGTVLGRTLAIGRNIYNEGQVRRTIYSLQVDVQPGNSGGPYVVRGGRVAGLIFARSESYASTGYAIAASELAPIVQDHAADTAAVATGRCAE